MSIKLPKQWKHWCKKAGLRPEGNAKYARRHWAYFSLRGLGRRWRVNCHKELSVSYKEEYFDRWAISLVANTPLPTTEAQFLLEVKRLRKLGIIADKNRQAYLKNR